MVVTKLKKPIEKAFNCWISSHPESYHPLDMHRFYVFVKTVARYSRRQKNSSWLRGKIKKYKQTNLTEKDIEYYCNLFETLLDFSKVRSLPLCSIVRDNSFIDDKYEVKIKSSFTTRKRRR